ncbi:hypothetical protein QCA50_018713 [Cerrena zonata]|uniref:Uncharacterized protein n=1 Tax=Cerrena zonata TaxID=2478898 RepID=A0AAW0FHF7_9APHY
MWHPCSPLPEGLAESLDIYYSKCERLPFIPTAWVKSDFLGQDDILDWAGLNWTHYVPTIRLSEEEEESLESLPLSDPKKKKKKATSKAQIESEDELNGEGNKADAKGGNIPEDIAIEVDVDVEMADNAGVETVDDEEPEPIVPPKRTRHATQKMELVANEHYSTVTEVEALMEVDVAPEDLEVPVASSDEDPLWSRKVFAGPKTPPCKSAPDEGSSALLLSPLRTFMAELDGRVTEDEALRLQMRMLHYYQKMHNDAIAIRHESSSSSSHPHRLRKIKEKLREFDDVKQSIPLVLEGLKDIKELAKKYAESTEQLRVATATNEAQLHQIDALHDLQASDREAAVAQTQKIEALYELVQSQLAKASTPIPKPSEMLTIAESFLTDLQRIELPTMSTPSTSHAAFPSHTFDDFANQLQRAAPSTHQYFNDPQHSPIVTRNIPTVTDDRTANLSSAMFSVRLGVNSAESVSAPLQQHASASCGISASRSTSVGNSGSTVGASTHGGQQG